MLLTESSGKTAKKLTKAGTISGCDFAGVVEELGPNAEATGIKGALNFTHYI